MKVVIIEGQYNPLAYTEKSRYLNKVTHNELESFAKKFKNVTFFSRSNVMQFTEDDYMDAVHVKSESGYRFVESLMKNLETFVDK